MFKRGALPRVTPCHVHDLRRTSITRLPDLGFEPFIGHKIANHVLPGVLAHYNHNEYLEKRKQALHARNCGSHLNGLTLPQFFLCWAWAQNDVAKYCLDGTAIAHGWQAADAVNCGVIAAISAAKSLAHAKLLMATGQDGLAQHNE